MAHTLLKTLVYFGWFDPLTGTVSSPTQCMHWVAQYGVGQGNYIKEMTSQTVGGLFKILYGIL